MASSKFAKNIPNSGPFAIRASPVKKELLNFRDCAETQLTIIKRGITMAKTQTVSVATTEAIPETKQNPPKPFEIGLVMAGAVSAGAYTAGVLDFLMEALQTWEDLKLKGEKDVPTHQVKIKVITGASAGAITAAVFASSVRDRHFPLTNPRPLRKTWVNQVDIEGFLGATDFGDKDPENGKTLVKSLLDSTFLDRIGDNVFTQSWDQEKWPAYLSDPLQMYFTVTNLRGVPYSIDFTAGTPGQDFGMAMHADYMHFILSPTGKTAQVMNHALPLGNPGNRHHLEGNWSLLKNAALASGAFPIGLAARVLERAGIAEYNDRPWPIRLQGQPTEGQCKCMETRKIPPAWPNPWPDTITPDNWSFRFVNVDGGVANNEPFELARRCLAEDDQLNKRSGNIADRAVLMIDPFPNSASVDFDYDGLYPNGGQKIFSKLGLFSVMGALIDAVTNQLRFKMEELELAKNEDVHSRWVISPSRYIISSSGEEQPAKYALASDGLFAFAGFLRQSFREHDYQLGRRNCQKFLTDTFVLREDNPVIKHEWTENAKKNFGIEKTAVDKPSAPGRYLPVIPLYGDCKTREETQPLWPQMDPHSDATRQYFSSLRKKLQARAGKLYFNTVNYYVEGVIDRALLKIGWYLFGAKKGLEGGFKSLINLIKGQGEGIKPDYIVDPLLDKIKEDFQHRELL